MDWFGTDEELEKMKANWKKACEETEGVHSTKLMVPHSSKYHYAWFTKADSYVQVLEANAKATARMPRDKSKLTHSVLAIYTEA